MLIYVTSIVEPLDISLSKGNSPFRCSSSHLGRIQTTTEVISLYAERGIKGKRGWGLIVKINKIKKRFVTSITVFNELEMDCTLEFYDASDGSSVGIWEKKFTGMEMQYIKKGRNYEVS